MDKLTRDSIITDEMIERMADEDIGLGAVAWLREQPRTYMALLQKRPSWAAWAMATIDECPIYGLELLPSFDLATVMINRPDCPLDLLGRLDLGDLLAVMANRSDWPLDRLD